MLLGKVATDFSIPVKPMVYTPPAIPTGVPSQLAERRPDVAAAERTLAEANATIGIGYGAFFPQVTLSAAGGFESSTFKHLFDWPSRFWSIGPSASQTIFDGGLYRAELHQYEAHYNADLATYRQTVLTAFQQVEDALAATRIYSQQILRAAGSRQVLAGISRPRNAALQHRRRSLCRCRHRADHAAQQPAVTLNSLQVEEMLSAVQLVQALGGGWDRSQLPTPAQAGAKTRQQPTTPCSASKRGTGFPIVRLAVPVCETPVHRLAQCDTAPARGVLLSESGKGCGSSATRQAPHAPPPLLFISHFYAPTFQKD